MTRAGSQLLASGRMVQRFLTELPAFLRDRAAPGDWVPHATQQLHDRERAFSRVLARGVFERPESPYGRLMSHAGFTAAAVTQLIGQKGVEGALAELFDAGVYLSHAEFKGEEPVRRGALSFRIAPRDLDNPLASDAFVGRTGGSRSAGKRVTIDLGMLALEAPHHGIMLDAFGIAASPMALWRDVPPAAAGIKDLLRFAKIGRTPLEWFTPYRWPPGTSLRHFGITAYAHVVGRFVGNRVPFPRLVPFSQAAEIAAWLAARVDEGAPGILDTTPSGAVRVCAAAREAGLRLDGSVFLVAGEPFTASRAAILERSGTRGLSRYAMTEVGIVGMPCVNQSQPDECHVLLDKVALLLRPTAVGVRTVDQVHLTTLHPASPKILINTGTGDYAEVSAQSCGCALHAMGLTTIIRNVRSFEKLTSEGMTFEGEQLLRILDEVLPGRFGGQPTDYQFVESEEDGLTRVTLLVSERVGEIDEAALIETVLTELGATDSAKQLGAGTWRAGRTLRVARREPHVTSAMKVQPLHILKP